MSDIDQRQELERYANADAQPNQPVPRGHALVRPTQSITPLGAQHVARNRPTEGEIKWRIAERAASAGDRWFYRFPVKSKDGSTAWIEGPSVKAAMSVLMLYGNAVVEVRSVDHGDAWEFYARFTDYETGASIERSYRQHKGQASIKSKDPQRALDLVYQIGQSKAERNVICNALEHLTDFAFEEARGSLVNKIGQDIEGWRSRTLDGLARMPVEVQRVANVIGRAAKDWLAPDIATVVSLMRGVADGMATIDETFPPVPDRGAAAQSATGEKATPSTTSVQAEASPTKQPAPPSGDRPPTPAPAGEKAAAASAGPSPPDTQPVGSPPPTTKAQYFEMLNERCAKVDVLDAGTLLPWFVSDQQRKIRNAVGMVKDDTDQARLIVQQAVGRLRGET